jgi:hypothetical protein
MPVTYGLVPGPVATHKIAILSLPTLKVTVWAIINARGKLGVCEHVVDDLPRVTVPKVVVGLHPLWYRSTLGVQPLVLGSVGLPRDVSKSDCIDPGVEIFVIGDGGGVTVGDERGSPDVEQLVNKGLR